MRPVLVLHTTQGSTIAGAVAWMRHKRTECHRVYDPRLDVRQQLLSWSEPARSLRNRRGGIETNRRGLVYQLEIVGFAESVDHYSGEWHHNLALELHSICDQLQVPKFAPYRFIGQDAYGLDGAVRLSADDWLDAAGIIGHQHVPENTHWDPGPIGKTIARFHWLKENPSMPDRTENVTRWQQWLVDHGHDLGTSGPEANGVDGDFGPRTEAASIAQGDLADTDPEEQQYLVTQSDEANETRMALAKLLGLPSDWRGKWEAP